MTIQDFQNLQDFMRSQKATLKIRYRRPKSVGDGVSYKRIEYYYATISSKEVGSVERSGGDILQALVNALKAYQGQRVT